MTTKDQERELRARNEENERMNAFLLEKVEKCCVRIYELEQELVEQLRIIEEDERDLAYQARMITSLKAKLYDLQNPDA
jgi:uncharacterized coiled-coil protein SlyX